MSNFKIIITIGIIILIGLGWYLFSSSSTDQQASSQSVAEVDSLETSDRPVFTTQPKADTVDSIAPRAGEGLAPGRALLKGIVQSSEIEEGGQAQLVITVDEVMEYGSSTPPISVGQELRIDIRNMLENNSEGQTTFEKGNRITAIVSSQKGMSVGSSENKADWSLVELKLQ